MEALNTARYTVSTEVSFAEALSWKLGKLMPSDRRALEKALLDPQDRAALFEAVEHFVTVWEDADWLEEYTIVRVGRWIAKRGDDDLTRHFTQWASQKQTPAREALLEGLRDGASL
jgi:hypothetical protein